MTATARCIASAVLAIGTIGVALSQETTRATFQDTSGKQIGSATLTQTPNGVLIDIDVSGLLPGERRFHFHHRSHPSGEAGDRIACAVIERPGK